MNVLTASFLELSFHLLKFCRKYLGLSSIVFSELLSLSSSQYRGT